MMNANVKSAFLCGKYIIPHMIEAGGGSVINISSTLGLVGRADVPSYSASKGGLIAFTRSLALRYASARVRVNCICPGAVVTEMFRDALEKSGDVEGKRRELEAKHPLGLGTPMDVAYAALYLAADESMWVTGSALVVDGGYTAG